MPSLPARIQARLCQYYGIEGEPAVDAFIDASIDADEGEREALLIRDGGNDLELSLRLPRSAVEAGGRPSFDELCQVIEGVSHFVYVAERARRELPATQLELELQAEVDKYLLFTHSPALDPRASLAASPARELARSARFEPGRAARLRAMLFERVTFLDPEGTEPGDRYRMANDLAARFAGRLERHFARHGRFDQMRAALRRFYCAGQTEKIELARAA
jgi:hypothetical protein